MDELPEDLKKFLKGEGKIIFDIPKEELPKYFKAVETTTNFEFLGKKKRE